jgi:hypothetical protein
MEAQNTNTNTNMENTQNTSNTDFDYSSFIDTDQNLNEKETPKSELYVGVGKYQLIKIEASEELDDKNQRRIKFIFKSETVNSVVSKTYWVGNEKVVSKTTNKPLFINSFAKTTYAESAEAVENIGWFDTTGLREALVGEAEITKDLRVLSNIKKDNVFNITKMIPLLVDGNIEVLNKLFLNKETNLMVGVRTTGDKQYSTVFPTFKPYWVKDAVGDFKTLLEKELDKEYSLVRENEKFIAQPLTKFDGSINMEHSVGENAEDLPF